MRDLAQRHGLELLEVNFERDPDLERVFAGSSARRALDELAPLEGKAQEPGECLLFLDEIQARPELLAKYAGRLDTRVLDLVLASVASQPGAKFVYSRTHADVKHVNAKASLELLAMSRLLTLATHSSATGIPLAGAADAKKRKALFLDVGLAHALLRTPAEAVFPHFDDLAPDVRGRLAEQVVGQELRAMEPGSGDEPVLHYWQREGGRPGEVDYLVEIDQRIVPVEIKAGAAGAMKSLHQFMHDKKLSLAIRVDTNPPSAMEVNVSTTQGDPARYTLLSLPGYLLWRAKDLVRAIRARRPPRYHCCLA